MNYWDPDYREAARQQQVEVAPVAHGLTLHAVRTYGVLRPKALPYTVAASEHPLIFNDSARWAGSVERPADYLSIKMNDERETLLTISKQIVDSGFTKWAIGRYDRIYETSGFAVQVAGALALSSEEYSLDRFSRSLVVFDSEQGYSGTVRGMSILGVDPFWQAEDEIKLLHDTLDTAEAQYA